MHCGKILCKVSNQEKFFELAWHDRDVFALYIGNIRSLFAPPEATESFDVMGFDPIERFFLRQRDFPKRNVTNMVDKFLPPASLKKQQVLLERDDHVTPIPCLKLTSYTAKVSRKGSLDYLEMPHVLALLHFDYDGVEVDPNSAPYSIQRRIGNRLVTTARQHSAELKFADQLVSKKGLVQTYTRSPDTPRSRLAYTFLRSDGGVSWLNFLHQEVPALRTSGWRVEVDKEFADRFSIVQLDDPNAEWDASLREKKENSWWLSFDLGIIVEGKRVPLLPLLVQALKRLGTPTPEAIETLANKGTLYVNLPDGRPLALPFERVREILMTLRELCDQRVSPDGAIAIPLDLAMAFSRIDTTLKVKLPATPRWITLLNRLKGLSEPAKVQAPRGLEATLRPYQLDGLNWLQFLREYGLGGILADDMGLGKTVQALAHILIEKEAKRLDRPCLVVCPTSLIPNWETEAKKFAPQLKVLPLQGKDRATRFDAIANADLVLTTYPLLSRDVEVIMPIEWHMIVLDEAQAIKNPTTRATQIVCDLQARHRLCLTGTPIENHLGEVWSLFDFLMPGMLGNNKDFAKRFRHPIEKQKDTKQQTILAGRLKPFILRRNKSDVAKELPSKTEIIHYVELNPGQRDLYETVRLMAHEKVQEVLSDKGFNRSRIVILDALLKLRQVCCDPRLVKLASAQNIIQSAKLQSLTDMLPEMIEEGRRILLFSQFTSMLDLIKPELIKANIPFVELRGDTLDRKTPVQRFQNCEVPVFLISLKAGGTGLNLTSADTVIHYDPWWNPAVEIQATDRAHRIGQTKPVFVYKFIAKNTVEERILEMQNRKRDLAATLLNDSLESSAAFTVDDIEFLFQEFK
jgi:SNF2 family DNA or RNA helicase